MLDFTVERRGTDSTGRGIYATAYMWAWWLRVCNRLGFMPVVTQGAFMTKAGGGAAGSAGYHDKGGTFDLRVWNLTDDQVTRTVRTLRAMGAAAWLRNREHGGFGDPHIHLVLGTDFPLSSGAQLQWHEYLAGRDGLKGRGPDYHWRPDPLVTEPPLEVDPMRIDGVDISHHQNGVIDWAAAKRAGVKFVWHKATEGATMTDALYPRRRREVADHGLPFGAYHFAHPDRGDAADEARAFLTYADPAPGDLLPVLDLETNGANLSRAELTDWVGEWVGIVGAAVGVLPVIYTPFHLDDSFNCRLWVARYSDSNKAPNVPQPWARWSLWQFSDGVYGTPKHVPGVGHVDINTFRDGLTIADLLIPQEDEVQQADINQIVAALKPVIEQATKDAVAGNMVAVGKPAKWSDDNALARIIKQLNDLTARVDALAKRSE